MKATAVRAIKPPTSPRSGPLQRPLEFLFIDSESHLPSFVEKNSSTSVKALTSLYMMASDKVVSEGTFDDEPTGSLLLLSPSYLTVFFSIHEALKFLLQLTIIQLLSEI
jgi:hypothetical protein